MVGCTSSWQIHKQLSDAQAADGCISSRRMYKSRNRCCYDKLSAVFHPVSPEGRLVTWLGRSPWSCDHTWLPFIPTVCFIVLCKRLKSVTNTENSIAERKVLIKISTITENLVISLNLLSCMCDSSGGMSSVHVLLTCTRLPLSKRDTLASVSEAIKARPCTL
jgi:hypothetical protein